VNRDVGGVWNLSILAFACAAAALPIPAQAVERWYSAGLYPPLQRLLTSGSNVLPFAVLDVLIVAFPIAWIAAAARDAWQSPRRLRALGKWMWRTVVAAAAVYLLFLVAWGLNYRRVPLERKLQYDARGVTADAARDAAGLAASRLNMLFAEAHADPTRDALVDPVLAAAFARATKDLAATGTTVVGRPKRTLLDFYFRRAGVAGMTDPFFLETLVESDLLAVERPFVVAHEWSHLAGFADEGEANFAGWLTCVRAGTAAQYSGWLFLFGELVNSMPRANRAPLMAALGAGPRSDLRAIAARLARDVTPAVSAAGWRVYDQYLKANRVEAGAASYAQVVRLVLGTRVGLTVNESASPAR
jgi:hypothetical protein